jgi:RecQ family ATP-dependent DNA helicase
LTRIVIFPCITCLFACLLVCLFFLFFLLLQSDTSSTTDACVAQLSAIEDEIDRLVTMQIATAGRMAIRSKPIPDPPVQLLSVDLELARAKIHHLTKGRVSTIKPFQQLAISATLLSRDCFVVAPTGSGKSMCFQIPGIWTTATQDVTVVISPLCALITDQVTSLNMAIPNVAAHPPFAQHFDHTQNEHKAILPFIPRESFEAMLMDKIIRNDNAPRFVYVTPEHFVYSSAFKRFMYELMKRHRVKRFVLDEVHTILEWGASFRPALSQLSSAMAGLESACGVRVPRMAVTATVTPTAQETLARLLLMEKSYITVREPLDRPNIKYVIAHVPYERPSFAEWLVLAWNCAWSHLILELPQLSLAQDKIVIYVLRIKDAESLADAIGPEAVPYHSEMTAEDKQKAIARWLSSESGVIVSTSALGMGLDIPNVRAVVHLHMPQSLQALSQETGRAGRDGKRCVSIIVWNPFMLRDLIIVRDLGSEVDIEGIVGVLSFMHTDQCRRKVLLRYLGDYSDVATDPWNCCDAFVSVQMTQPQDMTMAAQEMLQQFNTKCFSKSQKLSFVFDVVPSWVPQLSPSRAFFVFFCLIVRGFFDLCVVESGQPKKWSHWEIKRNCHRFYNIIARREMLWVRLQIDED